MERAHRLAPEDATVALSLGAMLLERGAAGRAAPLLEGVARGSASPDAWIALAACQLALQAEAACLEALGQALRSRVVGPALAGLATRIVERFGGPGWCGLEWDAQGRGRVQLGPGRAGRITLDGVPVRGAALPARWRRGRRVEVEGFVGSPLPVQALIGVQGFVAFGRSLGRSLERSGLEGWAWYPGDPERDPTVVVRGATGRLMVAAVLPAEGLDGLPPLARPRRFGLSAEQVEAMGGVVAVLSEDGRSLLGSPLPVVGAARPVRADRRGPPPAERPARAVDVVVPVHGGGADTLACLEAVLASLPAPAVLHVIDDGTDDPVLVAALDGMRGRINLLRHGDRLGFPAAANAGIRAAGTRDVVLLNSDTLVPPGWLERLRRAAYSGPGIGSVTPLSNEATIASYPDPAGGNAVPDHADAIAQRANAGLVAELPVGVGFCLYLRRDCLDEVGTLREALFAQGYGEENDWCLRARHAGWRHVAALDVFVAHLGGRSFGAGRVHLQRRNGALLERLYPGYDALIAAHIAADPLFAARRRMDALRWRAAGQGAGAVVLVTHGAGGGVAELVAARCAAVRAEGARAIVLRPAEGGCVIEGSANLRFRLPEELDELAAVLREDGPSHLEVHHLLGHSHAVLDLAGRLGIAIDTWVHDDAAFCARIALVDGRRRYCGEPDVSGCVACVAASGSKLAEAITVPALVARSAAAFAASRRVVVPTRDGAQRLRRHFAGVRPELVAWEDDGAWPPLAGRGAGRAAGSRVRVAVVGAIGVEKGYDVLLGCVQDARRRSLPLDFVVCGHTEDDERLLAAGAVFITGRYEAVEAVALIQAQAADLAFVPSVWPEVWCFALSRAWQAGLQAVAFDLGAQAERIRATGRGSVLPLGLPVPAINDALLRLARSGPSRQSLQP